MGTENKNQGVVAEVHSNDSKSLEASSEHRGSLPQNSNGKLVAGPAEDLSTWRLALIMFSLCFGCLLSLMDITIVSTAIYTIAIEFDSFADANWVVLAYTLCDLGFAVVFARISDFTGRKTAVVAAFTVFFAFSLGAGFAQTLQQLIVCRALQGIGGSGLYALAIILLSEVSTPKNLPLISGLIGATVAISGVLGPLVGGLLTQYTSWRWIFWLNCPCCAIAVACFFVAWPNDFKGYDEVRRPWSHFDIVGTLLFLGACVMFLFGLEQGGAGVYAWNSSIVVGTLVVGCLCWPAIFGWEWFVSNYKEATVASTFPIRLLKNRVTAAAIPATLLTGLPVFTVIFNLPLHFQIVNGDSSAMAGVHLLPFLCAAGVGSFIGGAANSKKNNTAYTFVIAACFVLLGTGLLSTISSSIEFEKKIYGFQVLLGIGTGMTFSTVSLLISINVSFKDHAVAHGIVAQMRVLGGSIGVAMANALVHRQAKSDLQGILTNAQIGELQTSPKILNSLGPVQQRAVQQVYSDAFNQTMLICTYMAAINLVLSLFTYRRNPAEAGHGHKDGADEVDQKTSIKS